MVGGAIIIMIYARQFSRWALEKSQNYNLSIEMEEQFLERLYSLGLTDEIYEQFLKSYGEMYLGRVIFESKGLYKVATQEEDIVAEIKGSMNHQASHREDLSSSWGLGSG